MSRQQAYRWLMGKMGLSKDECHIGMMDEEQAKRVVGFAREELIRLDRLISQTRNVTTTCFEGEPPWTTS